MGYKIKSRIWIESENNVLLGEGRVQLLKAIQNKGSLSKAAKSLNISYKKAWQLLDSVNKSSKKPVTINSIGGKGGGGNIYSFLLILPIVSFLYSSVGHGGASGYLALMALFSFAPESMKPTALLLNIFVAGISFYYYYKAGHFNKKLFLAFAITSIPLAFLGGTLEIEASIYKKVLALLLIFAILKMLNVFGKETQVVKTVKLWQGTLIGGIIGFFSGLIGIGGGIILTPVILLLHWGKMKEARNYFSRRKKL